MSYIITKYFSLDDEDQGKDVVVEENTCGPQPDQIHLFRVYDDDGVLYFEGYSNDSSSAEPLTAFRNGCTEIRYFNNGKWETR